MVRLFKSEGCEPVYGTPDTPNDTTVGLYCYLDMTYGTPSYVFTDEAEDTRTAEDYYTHIKDYAKEESVDGGQELELVDARQFLSGGKKI